MKVSSSFAVAAIACGLLVVGGGCGSERTADEQRVDGAGAPTSTERSRLVPGFSAAAKLSGSAPSRDVALGDFDADGDLDIFAARDGKNIVWQNTGQGGWSSGQPLAGSRTSTSVITADFNDDGRPDVLVTNDGLDDDRVWFNLSGNGSAWPPFSPSSSATQGLASDNSRDAAVADFDRDGDRDIWIVTDSGNEIWYKNDSSTGYTSFGSQPGGNGGTAVAVADFDSDGYLDAVVARRGNANALFMDRGNGNLGFKSAVPLSHKADSTDVAVGDVDGDADLDLVVANAGGAANTVWTNDGTGSFTRSKQNLGSADSRAVSLSDVDGDGDLDAIVANAGSTPANRLWENDGTGSFKNAGQSLGSAPSEGLAVGELDADGDPDAIFANGSKDDRVWTNQRSRRPDANYGDSGQQLGSGGGLGVELADVDADGVLEAFVLQDSQSKSVIWENNGGIFSPTNQKFLGSYDTFAVALGDVDRDGDLDAYFASNGRNYLFRNDGTGTFGSRSNPGPGFFYETRDAEFGDVDGDGDLDIYVASVGPDYVYANDGTGSFPDDRDKRLWVANDHPKTEAVELSDVDRDGDLDAVLAWEYGKVGIRRNENGNGQYSSRITEANVDRPADLSVADFNNDGAPDIFVVSGGFRNKVLLNNGRGGFSPSGQTFSATHDSRDVELGDFDADGDVDAFVVNKDAPNAVWTNDGTGTFTKTSQKLGGKFGTGSAMGDVDGDGDLDVLSVADAAKKARVWENTNPPHAVSDTVKATEDGPPPGGRYTFDILANDWDLDGETLTLRSVTAQPSHAKVGVKNNELEFETIADHFHDVTVDYIVEDPVGRTGQGTATIDVQPVNDQPSMDRIADQQVDEDSSAKTVGLSGLSVGPREAKAGQTLSFRTATSDASIIPKPTVSHTAGASTATMSFQPKPDAHGNVTLTVTADDGQSKNNTVSRSFSVEVRGLNDPPQIDEITDKTVAEDSGLTQINLTGLSPGPKESQPLDITATASKPGLFQKLKPNYSGGSTGTLDVVPAEDANGTATITVELADLQQTNNLTTERFRFEITPVNDAPRWKKPTKGDTATVQLGDSLKLDLEATDVEGQSISYDFSPKLNGAMIAGNPPQLRWTPTVQQVGTHTVTLKASDGSKTGTRNIDITVEAEDSDGDGLPNAWESDNGLKVGDKDSDGDTIADGEEVGGDLTDPRDTDGDGTIDALDADSDGDGIDDAEEAGDDDLSTPPVDTDGDGTADYRDLDADDDGVDDATDNCRTAVNPGQKNLDGDELGDRCDPDTDGDGLKDKREERYDLNPRKADSDGDGLGDGREFGDGAQPEDGAAPVDTDDDDKIDALDHDADGDGVPDAVEAGANPGEDGPADSDDDGSPDYRETDADDDGVDDETDNCRTTPNEEQRDTDDDGVGDACSEDADGDGIPDAEDLCLKVADDGSDTDGDGEGDACDADIDGDGVVNKNDNCPLTPNSAQDDADGDGLGDACDDRDDTPDVGAGGGDVGAAATSPRFESGCSMAASGDDGSAPPLRLGALLWLAGLLSLRLRRSRKSRTSSALDLHVLALAAVVGLAGGCKALFADADSVGQVASPTDTASTVDVGPACEDLEKRGDDCMVGQGQCMRQGVLVCNADAGTLSCSAEPGEGADEEVCDGRDNDCDGVIDNLEGDEPVDLDTNVEHCGRCGLSCKGRYAHASAECEKGGCVKGECDDGFVDVNGVAADGCECETVNDAMMDTTCDGRDDDCDGEVDEDCQPADSDAGIRDIGTADTGTGDAETDDATTGDTQP